ncbi:MULTISPECIES: TIGR03905 family TSCPD domain-containing protein [unclassified Ruminococcus]|uniref:TIGR03905 family TSCPD domain-containing protein n=1 Tax=unclassified Ruminococcus TaxID=2608920 RepID=UPI00210D7308|nr:MULTISPECIES: TIGR03905 family TSCPD domain-containing protein [unclassified Ruminococcus]MCQ4022452.1 TIGR03905 family TSCPD domain-containing protein [Ruminococcus sp. zg-924]MCQ4115716.1 TIGR03905 family TSCPD domain-containing protein [Ruminococcus sp. zg-921]
MKFKYSPRGVCSQVIELDMEGNIIKNVKFYGGCNGNLKGIGSLVQGMKAEEVIKRCEGICCGMKSTSCPDQLAKALQQYLASNHE